MVTKTGEYIGYPDVKHIEEDGVIVHVNSVRGVDHDTQYRVIVVNQEGVEIPLRHNLGDHVDYHVALLEYGRFLTERMFRRREVEARKFEGTLGVISGLIVGCFCGAVASSWIYKECEGVLYIVGIIAGIAGIFALGIVSKYFAKRKSYVDWDRINKNHLTEMDKEARRSRN